MAYEQIIYEKADGIATITLNRPERMNAFTPQMLDEWYTALLDAHTDADVRVVILTGAGRAAALSRTAFARLVRLRRPPLARFAERVDAALEP